MDPLAWHDDRMSVDDLFPIFNTEESAIVAFVQLVAADGTTVPGRAYVPLPATLTHEGVAYEWFDFEAHEWPIDLHVHRYREVDVAA